MEYEKCLFSTLYSIPLIHGLGRGKLLKASISITNSSGGLSSVPGTGLGDSSITSGDGSGAWYSGDKLEDGAFMVGPW